MPEVRFDKYEHRSPRVREQIEEIRSLDDVPSGSERAYRARVKRILRSMLALMLDLHLEADTLDVTDADPTDPPERR